MVFGNVVGMDVMDRGWITDESRREDLALLERIRGGDADGDACRRLVEKYWKLLVAWVRPRVGDISLAEDVVQDTFIRAFRALDQLEDPRRFLGWLLRIAFNRAADLRRARHPDQSLENLLDDGGGPPGLFIEAEDHDREIDRRAEQQRVLAAVDRLPEKYRMVIMLRYFQGLSGAEIASLLGEPEGTIRNRLFRAHARVRGLLRQVPEPGNPRGGRA